MFLLKLDSINHAILTGNLNKVKDYYGNIKDEDKFKDYRLCQDSSLHQAIKAPKNKVEIFNTILEKNKTSEDKIKALKHQNENKETILHIIAKDSDKQNLIILENLEKQGLLTSGLLSLQNKYEHTAYFLAKAKGKGDLYKFLQGSNINHLGLNLATHEKVSPDEIEQAYKTFQRKAEQEATKNILDGYSITSLIVAFTSYVIGICQSNEDQAEGWQIAFAVISAALFFSSLGINIWGVLKAQKALQNAQKPIAPPKKAFYKNPWNYILGSTTALGVTSELVGTVGSFTFFKSAKHYSAILTGGAPLVTSTAFNSYQMVLNDEEKYYLQHAPGENNVSPI